MNQRNKTVDIAKGIGIIIVVWGHMSEVCPIHNEIYLFHMPLFYILSGYFFKNSKIPFIDILKKNIQAYILPYIVFIVITLSVFIVSYIFVGRFDQIGLTPSVLWSPYGVAGPLWFLLSLFEVHCIYYFIARYIINEKWKWAIVIFCFAIGYMLYRSGIRLPLFIDSSLPMVLFFHIGKMMSQNAILSYSTQKQIVVVTISVLFYVIALIYPFNIDIKMNIISNNPLLFVLTALGGSYIIFYISNYIAKLTILSSVLAYLGKRTLIIFALHLLFFEIGRCFFGFPALDNSTYLDGICITVFSIVCSLIIGIPIQKFILSRLIIFKKTST